MDWSTLATDLPAKQFVRSAEGVMEWQDVAAPRKSRDFTTPARSSGSIHHIDSPWLLSTQRLTSTNSESTDTGVYGSDTLEDHCSVSSINSGQSFRPIRCLAPIPMATVTPSSASFTDSSTCAQMASTSVSSSDLPTVTRRRTSGPSTSGRPLRSSLDMKLYLSGHGSADGLPGKGQNSHTSKEFGSRTYSRSRLGPDGGRVPQRLSESNRQQMSNWASLHCSDIQKRWSSPMVPLRGTTECEDQKQRTRGVRGEGDGVLSTRTPPPGPSSSPQQSQLLMQSKTTFTAASGVAATHVPFCPKAETPVKTGDGLMTHALDHPVGSVGSSWPHRELLELRKSVAELQLLSGLTRKYPQPCGPFREESTMDTQCEQPASLHQRLQGSGHHKMGPQRNTTGASSVLFWPDVRPSLPTKLEGQNRPEIDPELEKRVADTEARIQDLSVALERYTQHHVESSTRTHEKLRCRERQLASLRKKLDRVSEQRMERQQRVESLERYLASLPTLEDHRSLQRQLCAAEEKVRQLEESKMVRVVAEKQMSEVEEQLSSRTTEVEHLRTCLVQRDDEVKRLMDREEELVKTVQSLQQKVECCLQDASQLFGPSMEQVQEENVRLRSDAGSAYKIIEAQQHRMETMTAEFAVELEREKERGSRAQNEVVAKREVEARAVKDLQEVMTELFAGASGLQVLRKLQADREQQESPDLSLLLGLSATGEEPTTLSPLTSLPELLPGLLERARTMRHDVDSLRSSLADHYAREMGDSCLVQ
uniref:centrosomal protein of 85 kDa-like isoform X1 n=3 Tax=Myxine glutinosa TaxID=7769 RepID=UPI00358E9F31